MKSFTKTHLKLFLIFTLIFSFVSLSNAQKVSKHFLFWNKIPAKERQKVVETALEMTKHSQRELAFHITDNQGWFISESSVCRILKKSKMKRKRKEEESNKSESQNLIIENSSKFPTVH